MIDSNEFYKWKQVTDVHLLPDKNQQQHRSILT